tara:strand:- start:14773 stop:15765 length:993 start_codon:yes stop_codon:yes gene_type:complete
MIQYSKYTTLSFNRLIYLNLKYLIKHLIWNIKFHKYNDNKKNIFLLTSRRSGGTWITQALSLRKNTKFVLEPYNVGYSDLINSRHYSNKILVDGFPRFGRDSSDVTNFFKKILYSNSIKCQEQWNFFSKEFYFFTDTTVIKTHSPKIFIHSLLKEFPEEKFIYLIRNPLAQCLSIVNKTDVKGKVYISKFLDDAKFLDRYINLEMKKFMIETSKNDQYFDKLFLSWILENLPVLRILPNKNILLIKYEDLVLDFELEFQKIEQFIGEKILKEKFINQPSMTTSNKSKKMFKSKDKSYIIERWKEKFSYQDLNKFQNILDLFKINIYNLKD